MRHRAPFIVPGRLAYTLTELVMVLVTVALTLAVAAPRYANSLTRYRADAAAKRIAADMALAQGQARATSKSQSVSFNVTADTYQLPGVTGLSGGTTTYVVNLADAPYSSDLVSASFGGSAQLTFTIYG